MDETTLLKMVAALGVGLAVGGGLMILVIAKWGRKLLIGEEGPKGERGVQGVPGRDSCPYTADHPKLIQFMGESKRDREDLRRFLDAVNDKVEEGNGIAREMKGKLDLLLQGARVRWNGSMPDGAK